MTSYEIEYIDLLKMDIEGGEKDVFKTNYEEWLSRTRMIIIEIHAHIEGCKEIFLSAISQYNFKELSVMCKRKRRADV